MNAAQRDSGYLADTQTAIAKIDRYTEGMALDDFMSNELVQDAVLRNIAIIGEAVSKLSDSLSLQGGRWRGNGACPQRLRRQKSPSPPCPSP